MEEITARSNSVRFSVLKRAGLIAFGALALGVIAPRLSANPNASSEPHHYLATGTLNTQDRIWAQTQIERVYYTHRIWPAANPQPKPPFETMVPAADIAASVNGYLLQSGALDNAGAPITAEMLQGEINRMVKTTNDPVTLQELFSALNGDPTLIAETLARPSLARHLQLAALRSGLLSGAPHGNPQGQSGFHGNSGQTGQNIGNAPPPVYVLPVIVTANCAAWSPVRSGAPEGRIHATAVWTGMEMIVWGGDNLGGDGARYNPAVDSWLPTSMIGSPIERTNHTAVWTGSEMIIWGGNPYQLPDYNTGGRYNPSSDTWQPTSVGANVPVSRHSHIAVWTGSVMIIWGGSNYIGTALNSGGRYNPNSDSWTPTSTGTNVPGGRVNHTAVWTGSEMIVWGGNFNQFLSLNDGGRYNPDFDTWESTSTGTAPPDARDHHSAVWTGGVMVVWGGFSNSSGQVFNSGGRYDPLSGNWTPTSTGANVPAVRENHTAVWSGSEMIVWGGDNSSGGTRYGDGGRYNPTTDAWTATAGGAGSPSGRTLHSTVWTGSEMIIWGGLCLTGPAPYFYCNSGGRYDPATDSWSPTYLGLNVPTKRSGHTAVWTGAEMIVWGGFGPLSSGGRYKPAINDWLTTSTSTTACKDDNGNPSGLCFPGGKQEHTAVWDGSHMLTWGGARYDINGKQSVKNGGKYNPVNDQWDLPITTTRTQEFTVTNPIPDSQCPLGYLRCGNTAPGTKLRRCPANDCCFPGMNLTSNIPEEHDGHTAVWNGTEMIVYGGEKTVNNDPQLVYSDWGRYNSVDNSWACKSATPRPTIAERINHTAIWAGGTTGKMIVWGGKCFDLPTATPPFYCSSPEGAGQKYSGGEFSPGNNFTTFDSWQQTDTSTAPAARSLHTAVWDGADGRMIVWGGASSTAPLSSGGRYAPSGSWSDTWIPGAPTARYSHTAVWTGATVNPNSSNQMIVWGGQGCENASCSTGSGHLLATGGFYDPAPTANSWTPTPVTAFNPGPRYGHTAVWTGNTDPFGNAIICKDSQGGTIPCYNTMIVWGGMGTSGPLATGSALNPLGLFITKQPPPFVRVSCKDPPFQLEVAANLPTVSYQWQRNGVNLPAAPACPSFGSPFCGAATASLTIDPRVGPISDLEGRYDAVVTNLDPLCTSSLTSEVTTVIITVFIIGPGTC